MSEPVVELVTYRVTDPVTADTARAGVLPHIQAMPGFVSYQPLISLADPTHRADMVTWATLAHAEAAAQSVMTNPHFAPFMETIAEVSSMTHFSFQWPTGPVLPPGLGLEVSFFRLKSGVDQAQARAAYQAAVAGHLSSQPGWLGEWMVAFGDGRYGDVLIARDQATAEAICRTWIGHPLCDAFLALIEDADMAFGTVL